MSDNFTIMVAPSNGGQSAGTLHSEAELAAKDARIAELEAAVKRHTEIYANERTHADAARDECDKALERVELLEGLLREAREYPASIRMIRSIEKDQDLVRRIDSALTDKGDAK